MTNLPALPGHDLTPLDKLSPKERLAVEFYTDPLRGDTFDKKTASLIAAGYKARGNDYKVFHKPHVKLALKYIHDQRHAQSAKAMDFLAHHAIDAAKGMLAQLGKSQGMEYAEAPLELLEQDELPKGAAQKIKAVNDYNRTVTAARRADLSTMTAILDYFAQARSIEKPSEDVELQAKLDSVPEARWREIQEIAAKVVE